MTQEEYEARLMLLPNLWGTRNTYMGHRLFYDPVKGLYLDAETLAVRITHTEMMKKEWKDGIILY